MIFVVGTFGLFYFTYLYNFLYVYEFTTDTGGLAFPRALYQTMTGIYFAEICLFGLFFITPGVQAQGIVMVVVFFMTILFHYQIFIRFRPLIEFLPIDVQAALEAKVDEQRRQEGREPDEESQYQGNKSSQGSTRTPPSPTSQYSSENSQMARSPSTQNLGEKMEVQSMNGSEARDSRSVHSPAESHVKNMNLWEKVWGKRRKRAKSEAESNLAPRNRVSRFTDEELTRQAFQHEAVRAVEPIIWIPKDEYNIALDEIYHTELETTKFVQITCARARLDDKLKVKWEGNPPDYTEIPAV
jgi:calcium permeable stress-gated cation channel